MRIICDGRVILQHFSLNGNNKKYFAASRIIVSHLVYCCCTTAFSLFLFSQTTNCTNNGHCRSRFSADSISSIKRDLSLINASSENFRCFYSLSPSLQIWCADNEYVLHLIFSVQIRGHTMAVANTSQTQRRVLRDVRPADGAEMSERKTSNDYYYYPWKWLMIWVPSGVQIETKVFIVST